MQVENGLKSKCKKHLQVDFCVPNLFFKFHIRNKYLEITEQNNNKNMIYETRMYDEIYTLHIQCICIYLIRKMYALYALYNA